MAPAVTFGPSSPTAARGQSLPAAPKPQTSACTTATATASAAPDELGLPLPATEGSEAEAEPARTRPRWSPINPRRSGARPTPPDFLSDRATRALIRRTLCAQHVADRGRRTPGPIEDLLPPLTSRNDVDLQLYALISIVVREFVHKWYLAITPDETFVAEIVQLIAHCTRALEQRLRKVDLESLLLDELPELLDSHVRAVRTCRHSAAPPPMETNAREIYHALCPMPALFPVPKPDDADSVERQAENEAAYRQLLVQGILALLLPAEAVENECLTSLVGQILSELIIGNLVAARVSEPWFIWESIIILARAVSNKTVKPTPGPGEGERSGIPGAVNKSAVDQDVPLHVRAGRTVQDSFWSCIRLSLMVLSWTGVALIRLTTWPSLPSRCPSGCSRKSREGPDQDMSYTPLGAVESRDVPPKEPILDFYIWPCVANLVELEVRMPWLTGALSMLQWGTMKGPGKLAAYDGIIDRLLAHHIQTSLLDPALLPPLLRSIRAAVFPSNCPGTSGLVAPSSADELAALRRRCASAVWAVIPKSIGRILFGASARSRSSSSSVNCSAERRGTVPKTDAKKVGTDPLSDCRHGGRDAAVGIKATTRPAGQRDDEREEEDEEEEEERMLCEIETGILDVFSDAYCNKHLLYGALELVLVRLMPELAERGVIELWEERIGSRNWT